MKELTTGDWITSTGRFPERQNSKDLTKTVRENADILIQKVNGFLKELGWNQNISLSSGFRPSDVNSQVKNAAKASAHMIGKALDILDDKDQTLAKLVESHPDLLRKYGLMMEDKSSTVGDNTNWVHLDYVDRPDRPSRVFKP